MLVRHRERSGEGIADRASDRGSAMIEWLALGVLAALILGGLVPAVGPAVSGGVSQVICRITHAGRSADCKDVPADGDPQTGANAQANTTPQADAGPEQCLVSVHNPKPDRPGFTSLLLNTGQGYKVIRYDTREKGPDGKTEHYTYLAFVNKNDTGINQQKAAKGTKIDIGGGYKIQYGHLYRMTPADAKKLTDQLEQYQVEQVESRAGNPNSGLGYWVYNKIKGNHWPPKITDTPGRYGKRPVSDFPPCTTAGDH